MGRVTDCVWPDVLLDLRKSDPLAACQHRYLLQSPPERPCRCLLRNNLQVRTQAFVPRRFSQLSDAMWDIGVLLLGEAVGLELGWLGVADLTGHQVSFHPASLDPTQSFEPE